MSVDDTYQCSVWEVLDHIRYLRVGAVMCARGLSCQFKFMALTEAWKRSMGSFRAGGKGSFQGQFWGEKDH